MLSAWLDRRLAPAPPPARAGWLGGYRYAHRGLHGPGVPENSAAAFAAAAARGLGIECDVQLSRDGVPMVFHDTGLDRLTAEHGPLAARTAAELERIALNGTAETIPALPAMLAAVGGAVPLLIEIKSGAGIRIAALCAAVEGALAGYRGHHAVMSFDPRAVRWFARRAPGRLRGLVMSEEDTRGMFGALRRHAALWHARPDFLACDVRDLPGRFAAGQRRRGLPVLAWTVRDAETLARAARHADAAIAEGAAAA